MALTFDDGPGGATSQVRQILRSYGVRATFFVVGERSLRHSVDNVALAKDGHLLAGHFWNHHYPQDHPWDATWIRDQLQQTNAVLKRQQGRPVCFVRPPGGILTNVMPAATAERVTVVLWSIDPQDWRQPATTSTAATERIVRAATTTPGRHPIVLLHVAKASGETESAVSANRQNTVAALPQIIRWYHDHGYRFVDLSGDSGLG